MSRRLRSWVGFVACFAFLSGAPSPAHAENAVRIGRAEGMAGETVKVPVSISNEVGLFQILVSWTYDPQKLVFLPPSIEDTVSEELDVDSLSYQLWEEGLARAWLIADLRYDDFYPPAQDATVLWLRFRIKSAAAAGESPIHCHQRKEIIGGTALTTVDAVTLETISHDGAVVVRPPAGPRPPEPLSFEQVLDRVEIAWQNLAAYDAIAIDRDGIEVARLAGDATSWSDRPAPVGAHVYGIAGLLGVERSTTVRLEIEIGPPVVKPVRDLACGEESGDILLTWTRASTYDAIVIRRDGVEIATLGGNPSSYTDGDPPDGAALYEVIGIIEGESSAPARCVASGELMLRAADVRARPGERGVRIPILLTTMDPVGGGQACVTLGEPWYADGEDYTLEGSLAELIGAKPLFPGHEGTHFRIVWIQAPPFGEGDFPPSVDAPFFSVIVDVPADAVPGTVVPVTIGGCKFSCCPAMETELSVRGSSAELRLVGGSLLIGESDVASVSTLSFEAIPQGKDPRAIRLSWRNADPYDRIVIERNGEIAADLPGDATSFVDALEPNRVYVFRITSYRGGKASFPATLVVDTFPANVLFRRGDTNGDGRVDLGDPIRLLAYLYAQGAPPACEDAADADDTGRLDLADPIFILNYLFAGKAAPPLPGPLTAGFDPTKDELYCE
ncbi:MAG: hypothetical protein JXP34_02165 [Planctomycetes bacterium]|nr:hypothetical protein [Planctomycetota bacterium]